MAGADEQRSPNRGQERGEGGRFAKGNIGGPGNPLAKQATAMRRAAMEAITPEHVAAMVRKATKKALEGDMQAARFVLDRVLGKPREEADPTIPTKLLLPPLNTPKECAVASQEIADALCKGEMSQAVARTLLEIIQTRLKAIELVDFDERLRQLEESSKGKW